MSYKWAEEKATTFLDELGMDWEGTGDQRTGELIRESAIKGLTATLGDVFTKGFEQGHLEGYEEGHDDGYYDGLADGGGG